MAKITIGGKEYNLPEMNFLAIERAWPYVQEATETLDPMKGPSAALAVFASAIMEEDGFKPEDFDIEPDLSSDQIFAKLTYLFKKRLKGNELGNIKPAMFELLNESGLEVTEGEAMAALAAALERQEDDPTLSPETALDTSSSLSQPESREEAGTG